MLVGVDVRALLSGLNPNWIYHFLGSMNAAGFESQLLIVAYGEPILGIYPPEGVFEIDQSSFNLTPITYDLTYLRTHAEASDLFLVQGVAYQYGWDGSTVGRRNLSTDITSPLANVEISSITVDDFWRSAANGWLVITTEASLLASDTDTTSDVYAINDVTGTLRLLERPLEVPADFATLNVSDDGRYVTYAERGALLSGQPNYFEHRVYRHDTIDQTRQIITLDTTGATLRTTGAVPDVDMSGDGAVFAYSVRDRLFVSILEAGIVEEIDIPDNHYIGWMNLSRSGHYLFYGADPLIPGGQPFDYEETLYRIDIWQQIGRWGTTAGDTITLPGTVKNYFGLGGNDIITGNALANRIDGGDGDDTLHGAGHADTLNGGLGRDTLIGGIGNDVMRGGDGNDTYVVDSISDVVQETNSNAATGGTDRIVATVTRTLGANIEQLILTGSAAINGTGNTLANYLVGNSANNVLKGLEGSDRIIGLAGNDFITGGAGVDVLTGGAGFDSFIFDTPSPAFNRDLITDFVAADDTIRLENGVFTALGATTGILAGAKFWSSATGLAHDADDRILYSTANGALYYDPDGNGALARVHFATLTTKPAISAADFFVI